MDTPNGLTERLRHALAIRPGAPGLVVVAALLVAAATGRPVTSADWFWPACAAVTVLAVLLNTARQDFWRRVQIRDHQHRMDTANALLNEHPPAVGAPEVITGSIRELGDLVQRFGHQLDDLLTEVHAETHPGEQRRHA